MYRDERAPGFHEEAAFAHRSTPITPEFSRGRTMSDIQVQPMAEQAPDLSQWQRVANVFTSPSKTFEDIRRGNSSWWLPFLIVLLTGAFLYGAITKEVTWKGVYENQMRSAPEFAKRMIENMPPEKKAAAERQGPINQAVTWALSPLGLLLMNLVAALFLWPTINFGFGGRATFGSIFAVTMYATLVLWPIKLLLGGIALFAGVLPDAFNLQNVAGTNIGYYLAKDETASVLYFLATSLDPLVIWNLILTSIGIAIVARVKRGSGYIAVFGWWIVMLIIGIGFTAAFA
jgi:hypothetical protein